MSKKSVMLGRRNQITLPKEFVAEGATHYECEKRDDGSLVLIPQMSIPASQAYFWTKRWQDGEKNASRDIQSGRVRKYDSPEKLFSHLDRRRRK